MSDGLPAWRIAEPADSVLLLVESDGVWLRGKGLDLRDQHKPEVGRPRTRLGRLLPTLIPQLLELELAAIENGAIRISHADLASFENRGVDAFDGVAPWSPFTIELESSGTLGRDDFRYFHRFYLGTKVVHLQRRGCFVRRGETIYRLDSQTYTLAEAVDAFNGAAPQKRASSDAFIRFAEIKELAEGVGAQLDRFITAQRVLVPSRVGLDLIAEDGGRVTFAPKIDGVSEEAMRRAFLAADDVEEVYALDQTGGARVRVVLDNEQREVLRRMQRVRHLAGVDRAKVLRDPYAVFDGVVDAVEIDASVFGPRVKGIGDFPFVAQPYLRQSAIGVFDDCEAEERAERMKFEAGIACSYVDGRQADLRFGSREDLLKFWREAQDARITGVGTTNFQGNSILVDETFIAALGELVERVTRTQPCPRPQPKGRLRSFLLIYTNENEVEYDEPSEAERRGIEAALTLPRSLKAGVLQDHQREGLKWLQRNYLLGRRGCLLADDMGMGKTLQVLAFLAWLIERGEISPDSANPEDPPYDPILVVAPLVLLDSETWLNDARKFFAGAGAIFRSWKVLHGAEIDRLRRPGATGPETAVAEPVLDVEQLRQNRLVLTNYETVVNYQFSFAQLKAHWSVVVTDEAQEYRVPGTKRSHALKALAPRFRIACTGTPVETRLLDVWNIFDFLQPGHLLASAAEFTKVYERPVEQQSTPDLTLLKRRLGFGREDAFVIRREKKSLNGLPEKHEHELRCDLSSEQRQWHLDVLQRARSGGAENHPFKLIDLLMKIYQHPALVPQYDPVPLTEATDRCPKLGTVLDCLEKIRAAGEKALIFTRSLGMQQLLANALRDRFGINVVPVNGATPRRGASRRTRITRASILQDFRQSRGFNVSILSPDVAGIGLTLTEANHVIHYGRWWNPATESQATDRAYRIGQLRDVHVYYPIAIDPKKEFETFDEKLHALLCRRRRMAAEFLAPMQSEQELQREFISDVFGAAEPPQPCFVHPLSEDDVRRLPFDRFEALIAILEEKRGARVILTPLSGDDGIDVIAIRERDITIIQCKHTLWGASVDADVIPEVICAFDGYGARRLRPFANRATVRPVLVTNGRVTRRTRSEAKARDIQIIDGDELGRLLDATPCTPAEVEAMTARRLASMRDVQAELEAAARMP